MFTFAMVTFPIGSYFLTVNKLYGGKSLILFSLPCYSNTSSSHVPNILNYQLPTLTPLPSLYYITPHFSRF